MSPRYNPFKRTRTADCGQLNATSDQATDQIPISDIERLYMNKAWCVSQVKVLVVTSVLIGMTSAAFAEGITKIIRFRRDRTSTVIKDSVIRGDRDRYLLGARAGQRMTVNISALEDNAAFVIYPPGSKQTLKGAGEEDDVTQWSGKLPTSGNYTIIVGGTRGNASYRLAVAIK